MVETLRASARLDHVTSDQLLVVLAATTVTVAGTAWLRRARRDIGSGILRSIERDLDLEEARIR